MVSVKEGRALVAITASATFCSLLICQIPWL